MPSVTCLSGHMWTSAGRIEKGQTVDLPQQEVDDIRTLDKAAGRKFRLKVSRSKGASAKKDAA